MAEEKFGEVLLSNLLRGYSSMPNLSRKAYRMQTLPANINGRRTESRSALPGLPQEEGPDLQKISQNARSWRVRQEDDG